MPLERSLQKRILAHLEKLHRADPRLVYRKRWGSALATAGDPDVYGVWAGVPFEIELKRPGRTPTPLQLARLAEWARAGAVTGVVHDLPELQAILAEIATRLR